MNKNKPIDLLKNYNIKSESSNTADEKTTKNLITELEQIKKEWTAALVDLHKKQDEYTRLIKEVKDMRNTILHGKTKKLRYKRKLWK